MSLRNLRRSKGWSQDQLAEVSGVSIRTIQRLEAGDSAGLETQNALAAAFDMPLEDLNNQIADLPEADLSEETEAHQEQTETAITRYGWKGFAIHMAAMMLVITWLLFIAREFALPSGVVLWLLFMWGFALLGHLVTLLSKSTEESGGGM